MLRQNRLVSTPASAWRVTTRGDAEILVSPRQPTAVVRHPGQADRVASWADLDIGVISADAIVHAAPDGVWVVYQPQDADDGDSSAPVAAVHVGPDGTVRRIRLPSVMDSLGATRHGLWFRTEHDPGPDDHDAWLADTRVVVVSHDGTCISLAVDRRILFVHESGSGPLLTFSRSAPDADTDGAGTAYSYRYATASLPAGALPDHLSPATAATDLTDEALLDELTGMRPRYREEPSVGIPWERIDLPTDRRDAAVAALVDEFGDLAHYWRGADGVTVPLSIGLTEPRIDVVGEWPDTRVEVTFRHPILPSGRLRRTLRVFDEAGRILLHPYAAIHLMEDLDTRSPLPPAGESEVHDL